jgi:hypothetical protein
MSDANHQSRATQHAVAGLAVLQVALFAVPLIVLGQAIKWPASLRLPPAEALPLIAANKPAIMLGYWAYMLVSVALIPLAFALRQWVVERRGQNHLLDAVTFIGAAAGVLKTLGIVRWLVAMPALAATYVDPATDAVRRQIIEVTYLTLNGYAGAVGELLGVQLMSGFWVAGISLFLLRSGLRITGLLGLGVGLLFLAACLRTVLPEAEIIQTIAAPVGLVWFLILALVVARHRGDAGGR